MISKSPFKFLDSYSREDRAIFFGRDQEITELYRKGIDIEFFLVPKERSVPAKGLPFASKHIQIEFQRNDM
jgi:hypothetical protein